MQAVQRNRLILLGVMLAAIGLQYRLPGATQRYQPYEVALNFPYQVGEYEGVDVEGADVAKVVAYYAPTKIVYREYARSKNDTITLHVASMWRVTKDPTSCLPFYGYKEVAQEEVEIPQLGRASESVIVDGAGLYMSCSTSWHSEGHLYSRQSKLFVSMDDKHYALIEACKDADTLEQARAAMPELRSFVRGVSAKLDAIERR